MTIKSNKKPIDTRRITRIAVLIALSLIIFMLENAFPPILVFAPGSKMGLGNVVSLVALIVLGYSDAYIIVILKCVLASIFGGNVSALMYSLPAGVLSLTVMIILYQFLYRKISLISISLSGAVVHNIVQLAVASLQVGSVAVMTMLPLMLIASVIAGLVVGITAYFVIKYLPRSIIPDNI